MHAVIKINAEGNMVLQDFRYFRMIPEQRVFSGFSKEHQMLFAMQNFMMVAVAEYTMLAASVRILSKPAHLSKPTSLSFARRSPGTVNPLFLNCQSFFSLVFEAVQQVGARWTANSVLLRL
jgi:hypothetical protein